jgi:soluble lytic murein transglycosylase-like protein
MVRFTLILLGVDNVFDPAQNINAGVRYFKRLLKLYNEDVKLALGAYSVGIQRVLD